MQYDVIIIGGSISSLALASLISKNNNSVIVIEKDSNVGGNFKPFEKGNFIFDNQLFFNFFYKKGKIFEILKNLEKYPKFLPTGNPKLLFENRFYPISLNPLDIIKNKFITKAGKLKFLKYFIPLLLNKYPLDAKFKDVFKEEFTEPSLIEYLHAISLIAFHCNSFLELPFNHFKSLFRKFLYFKTSYPIGGWKEIILTLKYNIKKNGEILTNTKVNKIIIENQIPSFVNTNVGNIKGKVIISSLSMKNLKTIVDNNSILQKLERLSFESIKQNVTIYYLGLNKSIFKIKEPFIILDPPTIGFFNSNVDPSLAPPHKQLLTIMTITKNGNTIEQKDEERLKDTLMLSFNQIEDYVEFEEKKTINILINTIKKINNTNVQSIPPNYLNIPNFFLLGDLFGNNEINIEKTFNSSLQTFDFVKNYFVKSK